MSTLTPNYGLIVPDGTDTVEQVRADYATNLNTIDGIGGGGSGGHTIVNPNGTDMPAENKLQFTGGVTVTDDSTNGKTVVDISGSSVVELTQADYEALPDSKLTDDILYGLKDVKSFLDADILYLGTCYSLSERMVGCWIDGKPLYKRTWDFGSDILINSNTWVDTSIKTSDFNIEKIIGSDGTNSGGTNFGFIATNRDQTYVQVLQTRSVAIGIRYLTLYYTKTTDVAGSGTWTPSGVNAVHYDTNEQIIGTYLGKPLYQKTITFDTGVIASNIDYDITSEMPANCEVVNDSFVMTYTYDGHDYRNANINGGYYQDNTSHYFHFSIGGAQYNKHVELTIQYTKTTD